MIYLNLLLLKYDQKFLSVVTLLTGRSDIVFTCWSLQHFLRFVDIFVSFIGMVKVPVKTKRYMLFIVFILTYMIWIYTYLCNANNGEKKFTLRAESRESAFCNRLKLLTGSDSSTDKSSTTDINVTTPWT